MHLDVFKNNRGVTLLELIISLAIVTIIIAAIWSFSNYENKIFAASGNQSEIQSDVRTTIGYISKEVKYATDLTIASTLSDFTEISDSTVDKKDYVYVYLDGGSIIERKYTDSTNYSERKFSSNLSSGGSFFKKEDSDTISITLTSQRDSKEYQVDSATDLDNFKLINPAKRILGGVSGQVIRFSLKANTVSTSIPVSTIEINTSTETNPEEAEITADKGALTLNVKVMPNDATNKEVTWSISNEDLASIDTAGVVRAKKNGTVTITATAKDGSGITDSIDIVITGQVEVTTPVSSIIVKSQGDQSTVADENGTLQMLTEVLPATATYKNVTWSVNNSDIATIDPATGLLTAKNDGIVIVKATAIDGSNKYGTKEITIINQVELSISNIPTNPTVVKATQYEYMPQGTGGVPPYTFTFYDFSGWTTTSPTSVKFTGTAANGNNQNLIFHIKISDSTGAFIDYTITVKTVNPPNK